MKVIHGLIQGSAEWHAHRANYFNASDAPAMMGQSPYKSRMELLREKKTGITKDVDAGTQRRFDDGHKFEALARPLAEEIICEELFPVTGVNGKYSASFDGLTMLEDINFEHKTLNERITKAIESGQPLDLDYRIQMEQQMHIAGAKKTLFMASKWENVVEHFNEAGEFTHYTGDLVKELHVWYYPDMELRQQVLDGWEQFERDLENYQVVEEAPTPKAAPIMELPAIAVQVTGMVTSSNLDHYKAQADAFFATLPTASDLQTDEDFVNAKALVKYCDASEKTLDQTKKAIIAQTESIDSAIRLIDHLQATFKTKRLELDKVTKAREAQIKEQIIMDGFAEFDAFVEEIKKYNPMIVQYWQPARPNFAGVCKGKAIKGHREQVPLELGRAKHEAMQQANDLAAKITMMQEVASEYKFLFNDMAQIITKPIDDLRNLAELRITQHKQAEAAKLEAERERIRLEEEAKAQAKAAELARQAEAEAKAKLEAEKAIEQAQLTQPSIMPIPAPDLPQEVAAEAKAKMEADPKAFAKGAVFEAAHTGKDLLVPRELLITLMAAVTVASEHEEKMPKGTNLAALRKLLNMKEVAA